MGLFNILLVLESGIMLWILTYVVKGLGNGTLTSETLLPWFIAVTLPLALMAYAHHARRRGANKRSTAAIIIALPVALACLFMVHLMSWAGRWN